MKLVFATNNQHKIDEARKILGCRVELLTLADISCKEEIPETGSTFEANAKQKAQYIYEHYGVDCIADDSGLCVAALNGAPGIYSARYATMRAGVASHNDTTNMQQLLADMHEHATRTAEFRCAIALVMKGEVFLTEGLLKGTIIRTPRGENGFGYDPIFIPDGYTQTLAELPSDTKNAISHRSLALQQLLQHKIFTE